jgi:hypothetical protein
MSKITITRHDGNEQITQEIDAAELGAFKAAGWTEEVAAEPEGAQSAWQPKEPDAEERTPQTKASHKVKSKK